MNSPNDECSFLVERLNVTSEPQNVCIVNELVVEGGGGVRAWGYVTIYNKIERGNGKKKQLF